MARKLYDITIVLDMWKRWCKKYNLTMDECAKKYKYVREWALYKQGIICRDGVLVHLDGTPITPGTVGPNAPKTGPKAPMAVSPDVAKTKTPRPVLQYTLSGEFVKEWPSVMECERNGFPHGNVSPCCQGKRKSAYGYLWRYKDSTNP